MGWLFACFGYSKKRKRPKPLHKNEPQIRRLESYRLLESSITKESTASKFRLMRNESKEQAKVRTRKKVRFNLDVTIHDYQPILQADNLLESDTENKGEEAEMESIYFPLCKADLAESRKRCHPSSYRYSNCCDEDYDHIESFDGDGDEENEEEDDPHNIYHEVGILEEMDCNCIMPLSSSDDWSLRTTSCGFNGGSRRKYAKSVLIPVASVTQWRAIKAKRTC
ncbi:hypothetical protein Ancab_013063 [Ancistrocladus abbreviatus]